MLPTEKTKPKTDLSSYSALVFGPAKIGKCLSGETLVLDPTNGRPITLSKLVANNTGEVLTMKEGATFGPQKPAAYLRNEPAQLYRVRTQTGRTIEATASHPFLTREGWRPLDQLKPGDRVAVVADYENVWGRSKLESDWLKILAYLIADGSLCSATSPVFTKADPEVQGDFEQAVENAGAQCVAFTNTKGTPAYRIRGRSGNRNPVNRFMKKVGLQGLRSAEKFIPEVVFGLPKGKLALFLNRLFTCDGSVEMKNRISYSSTSHRLVQQVQHLLLRFGIVSVIRDKYLEGELYGSELMVCGKPDVLRFIDGIGFIGEKACKAEMVRAALYQIRSRPTQLDRQGSLLFDRIRSIKPTRVESVFDLTVEGTHNFIANDFIVHNSSWCSQAEDALFLATEPGHNSLSIFECKVSTWEEMLAACADLSKGKHDFKTIVVDTLDNAWRMCADFICRKHKIDHETDLPYGKGHALVFNEFQRVLNKLAFLPYGLLLVSHATQREVETRAGRITKMVPTLPAKTERFILGFVDMILYCDLETQKDANGKSVTRRVMRTKPNRAYEAGDRTGRLPDILPLDYQAFAEVFKPATNKPDQPS